MRRLHTNHHLFQTRSGLYKIKPTPFTLATLFFCFQRHAFSRLRCEGAMDLGVFFFWGGGIRRWAFFFFEEGWRVCLCVCILLLPCGCGVSFLIYTGFTPGFFFFNKRVWGEQGPGRFGYAAFRLAFRSFPGRWRRHGGKEAGLDKGLVCVCVCVWAEI